MNCKDQIGIFLLLLVTLLVTGCVPNNFKFKKELGQSGSGPSEFLSPTDLDLDSYGNLVVADAGNTRFQVISSDDGKVVASGGEFGVDKMKLQSISGIGVDKKDGVVWVCDEKGNKIVKFDLDGSPILKVTKHMKAPMDVAVDKDNSIYVIMARTSEIYKYSYEGRFQKKIGGRGKAELIFPTSIIIHDNIIYVTDFGGKRIVKLKLDGSFIEEIKNKGEYEEMKGPSGLFIDEESNLYVLDLGEVPVVILTPDGNLVSQVGTFGNYKGNFLYPTGVVAKNKKDVYVLDNSRNTILNFIKK